MKTQASLLFIAVACALPASASTLIYWDGTKVSGSDALEDKGSLGINAVRSGSGTWSVVADGGPGGAGDAYLNLASTANNPSRNNFTLPSSTLNLKNQSWAISGWFNRNASGTDMIFHFGSGDGYGTDNEFYLSGFGSDSVTLQNYNAQDVNLTTTGLAPGNWQSYVVNFTASGLNDGKGTLAYYLNGNFVNSDSTFTLKFDQSKLTYGGVINSGSTIDDRNFDGGVDDFALYDTPLTTQQITALHNRTATPLTVPEPTAALFGALGALALLRRRR